jgi:hypothetical protein
MLLLVDIAILIFGLPLIIFGNKIASKIILNVFLVAINATSETFAELSCM